MKLTKYGDSHPVGEIVAIECVDWGLYPEQHSRNGPFSIIKAMIYGEVVGHTEDGEGIVIAPQVFVDGDVRCALVIPWVTIRRFFVLCNKDDFHHIGKFEMS